MYITMTEHERSYGETFTNHDRIKQASVDSDSDTCTATGHAGHAQPQSHSHSQNPAAAAGTHRHNRNALNDGHVKSTDSAYHSRIADNQSTAHEHCDPRQGGLLPSSASTCSTSNTSLTLTQQSEHHYDGLGHTHVGVGQTSINVHCKHGFRTDSDMAKLTEELSKENSSLRSRLKGVNVLSTLLSEAREEVANLNTQKNKMEIAVENLQSRLHKLGADTSVDLAEHEIFMPGHDKQFLNSLISENMRLQKALKSGAKDASAVVKDEQQTERIKKLETIIQQLTQQRREKEKKIQELQELMKSSSEEKDRELAKLKEEVEKSFKAQENAEAICESLTGQAEQLREQVKAASKKETEDCQLQKERDERQKESEKLEQELTKLKRTASNLKPEEQVRILEQQVDQLEKENARLTDQLKEVIGMNTRWQRYNDQREAYVIKLSKTSYQQQSKITVLEQQCSDLTKEKEELKKDNDKLKRQDKDTRDAALYSADQQLAQKDEDIKELKRQNKDMRDLVQAVSSQAPSNVADKERIQMLEQQVTAFASDFKDERSDRERIQGHYTDALKELKDKDLFIEQLQKQLRQRSPGPLYVPYNQPSSSCRQQLLARGTPRYYGDDLPDLPTDVEIDGGGRDEPDGIAGLDAPREDSDDDFAGVGNVDGGDDEPLQCPHCFRGFSVADVEKFMQHTNTCQN
ncbi:uncharacterized protein [Amphiura filiformis]|uniref:uncharacterized protein isoform X2 n=1 Tax=Amphiura filiformis TaxID=82378 RepID=UPI003B212294